MIEAALRLLLEEQLAPVRAELAAVRTELRRTREALGAGRWVSRREAAEALGVSVDTIDRRIADGSIRARRVGGSDASDGTKKKRCAVRVLIQPPADDAEIAELARAARGVGA